jgi:hypothetical protein
VAEEIKSQGNSILESLKIQEATLKRVKHRTYQMLQSLGMSESILLLIERRGRADCFIFCVLAVLTLVFVYVMVWWVKPLLAFS